MSVNEISKPYYVALDIGTTSVGWAVLNEEYMLEKFKKKNMWGVRLFEEGKTAKSTRLFRSARRMLSRKKQRIALLKELIGEMVLEVDKNFFMRLEKGYVHEDERGYHYNLFIDEDFNDKDFYKKYPTIYHLRKHLCESDKKEDPRLIYLAMHHILKHRGHFLYEVENFNIANQDLVKSSLKRALESLFMQFENESCTYDLNDILAFLLNKSISNKKKEEQFKDYFVGLDKEGVKFVKELCKLLVGYKANLANIFVKKDLSDLESKVKISFSEEMDDDTDTKLQNSLGDDYAILDDLKSVYDYIILHELLRGRGSLSEAMISIYNQHYADLKELKDVLKKFYDESVYQLILKENNGLFYKKYVNKINPVNKGGSKTSGSKSFLSQRDLCDNLKKELEKNKKCMENDEVKLLIEKLENGDFLPKQKSVDNHAIPHQLHKDELQQILNKQSKFYPELEKNKDKIISLLTFRVPYYVGPTNPASKKFAWIIRKGEQPITPWTFEDEVNIDKTAELFIRRMTNNCTYLLGEPVVAKNSLLYSRYELLNELNKVRINDHFLSLGTKQKIIEDLFMKEKTVTLKKFEDYIVSQQLVKTDGKLEITGTQAENQFATSLYPWIAFKKIYKDDFDKKTREIEKLIEWITIFEDKKILKRKILKEMPHLENKLKQILKLEFKGWGRFSSKLLKGLRFKSNTGEFVCIMDLLENTNMNFMQILTRKDYGFSQMIQKENSMIGVEKSNDAIREMVSKIATSPANKKAILQAIAIVKEIVHIKGYEPKNIFIEFARSNEDKVRTTTRKAALEKMYKDLIVDEKEKKKLKKELNQYEKKLDKRKFYLYFLQAGKCLYTGKPLNIERLEDYQIDHIIPRTLGNDDYDNVALVIGKENQYKSNDLTLDYNIITSQSPWWEQLHKVKLISDKKLRSLKRLKFDELDVNGFMNRQLVETRQIIRNTTDVLNAVFADTKVVAVKASMVSEFRKKYELYKIRELNDFHHAHDAFITALIGMFILNKYPSLKNEYIVERNTAKYFYDNELLKLVRTKSETGFIVSQMNCSCQINKKTGELIWDGRKLIPYVEKVFSYHDCFITKKAESNTGELFDALMIPAKKANPQKTIPIKKGRDVTKYGGYNSVKNAYSCVVCYHDKQGLKYDIVNIPIMVVKKGQESINEYVKKETNESAVVVKKILQNQLFKSSGSLFYFKSAAEKNNAVQLTLNLKLQRILYHLINDLNISDNEVADLYVNVVGKMKKHYCEYQNKVKLIESAYEDFLRLSRDEQKNIMLNILKATKANAERVDNLIIGDVKVGPIGRMQSKIAISDIEFINQSVTGMFEKKNKI